MQSFSALVQLKPARRIGLDIEGSLLQKSNEDNTRRAVIWNHNFQKTVEKNVHRSHNEKGGT